MSGNDEWERISISELGWSDIELASTIDFLQDRKTVAFLVLYQGRIAIEKYWSHWLINDPAQLASANKSIVAILIGIAQENGFLQIEDAVSQYIPDGWSNSDLNFERNVTIHHLLTNTSGLNGFSEFTAHPGSSWQYSTVAFNNLYLVLQSATNISLDQFASEYLFKKIGINSSSHWSKYGMLSTGDLARIGLLIRNNGLWMDEPVIHDQAYLSDMLSPSQDYMPIYGYLWWLNNFVRGEDFGYPGETIQLANSAPEDMVAARGANNQKLYIIPSLDLVVVRLQAQTDIAADSTYYNFDEDFWSRFIKVINTEAK
jgi:CubicO group peptidase (beta-lactamase class C family)